MTGILNSIRTLSFPLLALSILQGCASGYAPVSDINASQRTTNSHRKILKAPNLYKVRAGDTLYSIAWRYGLDFKQLAKANNISSNFLIYKGQILTTKKSTTKLNTPTIKSAKADIKIKKAVDNSVKKPAKPIKKPPLIAKKPVIKKTTKKSYSTVVWRWPAMGPVINDFSNDNKGIDIKGRSGEAVFAAASGRVVYAGNGIIGYGNLIIIKHSEEYLSAYAHNSVILVNENKDIKRGEKVAEIGSSGTVNTILHFEIRKDGKPVNPIKYLPKK